MGYQPTDPPPPPPGREDMAKVEKTWRNVMRRTDFRRSRMNIKGPRPGIGGATRINLMPKRTYRRPWLKPWKKHALSKDEAQLAMVREEITKESTKMFMDGAKRVLLFLGTCLALWGLFFITVNFPWHLIVTVPVSIYTGIWINNKKKLVKMGAYMKETAGRSGRISVL